MPDITMCKGDYCPIKENCYRFMAKPDAYQSYFQDLPYYIDEKNIPKCEYFVELRVKNGKKHFQSHL